MANRCIFPPGFETVLIPSGSRAQAWQASWQAKLHAACGLELRDGLRPKIRTAQTFA
jgi:hypothetical protein